MAEQLLDRAQVRAALQQVRRERVAQGVRVDAALERGVPRPDAQPAAHVGGRQPAAGLAEEQRRLVAAAREGRAGALEVARERAQRGLAGGNDPRLGALALDAQLLGVEVDRADVES